MIDKFSNLEYDEFEVITKSLYGGVYDKLQMFDLFRDGQNLYFDLDVVITGDCNKFIKKEFTLCKAWWRKPMHTPLNSSIMSWFGDQSDIFKQFTKEFIQIYHRGIDQYIYQNIKYNCFTEGYCSYHTVKKPVKDYQVYLFNQHYKHMRWRNWCQKYLLSQVISEEY
tara:strand:- start:194 stop:694 length:501 start_codon:yes stop_codon:yes gene_type:complete